MSFFEWFSGLDVGVQEMNTEHKHILTLMNRLYDQKQANGSFTEMKQTIKELGEYTVKHFNDEERYMESIKYPDIEKHKLIHKDLLKNFGIHAADFEKTKQLDDKFFAFLKMWLSAHIQGIDIKYGQFAKATK